MNEKLLDMNILYYSYMKCRKGVDWKCSVQKFMLYFLENINVLRKELESGKYKQKPFFEFDIMERGKPRHIKSLHMRDRVLQRALCDTVIIPAIKKYLIYDNGASLKGKGISFSRSRVKCHLEKYYKKYGCNGWVLQVDFSKYFDSIPHDKLMELFRKYIHDEDMCNLIAYILSLSGDGVSVGIGSQVSQASGLLFLTPIDNYCKIVRSCKYYGRYMDDLYVIHPDKEFLKSVLEGIRKTASDLKMLLSEKKTHILPLKRGFTFLQMKYRLSPTGHISVVPVSKSFTRQRRKMKKLVNKLTREEFTDQYKCWRGNIKKYDCHRSLKNMDKLFSDLLNLHYSDNIKA